MPNASRKHRKKFVHSRRIEVTDEDGWTHVSNTHTLPSASRSTRRTMTDGAADDDDILADNNKSTTTRQLLAPSEPPAKLTLTELRKQFNTHLETWESSPTWHQLKDALSKDILPSQSAHAIENVVCIGLGSPSGFVQGGWVDRRSVAMYQLAALTTMIDCIKQYHATSTQKDSTEMKIIAQDPVFNTLDIQILSSLGIAAVDSPEGFNAVSEKTFLADVTVKSSDGVWWSAGGGTFVDSSQFR
uniref:Macrolide export ATP-binding/permease protein MacB n=1 Tax=Talaromyces marneffei PM1 TaxID=1077442 RepID=A0A093UMW5_TALMA